MKLRMQFLSLRGRTSQSQVCKCLLELQRESRPTQQSEGDTNMDEIGTFPSGHMFYLEPILSYFSKLILLFSEGRQILHVA